jgi:hypothetical protein
MVDEVDGGVDHLAEVVGRDVGGHADRDALAAVDEQVREAGGQHVGLGLVARVVVAEVDRVLVDPVEEAHGDRIEAALGVARGRGAEVGAAEVAVAVDQRVAQREALGHAHQRVVDRALAVGVVLAHHVAGDACALHVRPVGPGPEVVHAVEDPAVHGLEAVAGIREGARRDDRHRVVQEGALHLLLDLDGLDRRADGALALAAVVVRGGVI